MYAVRYEGKVQRTLFINTLGGRTQIRKRAVLWRMVGATEVMGSHILVK